MVCQPGRQGIDGKDAPGDTARSLPFECWVCHGAFHSRTLNPAEKNIFHSGLKRTFHIALVEKHRRHARRGVRNFHFCNLKPLAQPVGAGGLDHSPPYADRPVLRGAADIAVLAAILVSPGVPAKQVIGRADAQLPQGLGPGGSHAGQSFHAVSE
ncbi:hypothetical protein SDC9_87935 [bioreactor metagenome]|uniref:Uncharacterized protein n=1 Tax=bioreactor metagenome TaxID=1076179 RepID=A0A644ZK72_9ZZZZ